MAFKIPERFPKRQQFKAKPIQKTTNTSLEESISEQLNRELTSDDEDDEFIHSLLLAEIDEA